MILNHSSDGLVCFPCICFALKYFASILGTLLLLPGNEIRLVTVVDKYFKAHSNHRQLHLCERSYFRHKVFLCICIFASAQHGQGGPETSSVTISEEQNKVVKRPLVAAEAFVMSGGRRCGAASASAAV